MTELQVLLCGTPEVKVGEQHLHILRKRARATLFYLASQGGMVSRDTLLPLFWENDTDEQARKRLSDTLTRLRSCLPDPGLLQVEAGLVGLDHNRVYVDQLEFQALVESAGLPFLRLAENEPLSDSMHRQLLQAASLWRNYRFLWGARFPSSTALDSWLLYTSRRMEELHRGVLQRLASHYRASGDREQELHLLNKILQYDETDEETNLHTIQALYALDRPLVARRHYERMRVILRRELGIQPSERLTSLYKELGHNYKLVVPGKSKPDWQVRNTVQTPFIGRRAKIEQLQRLSSRGGGVLIIGESGQGKTRLMQEFSLRITGTSRILLASCRPLSSSLPFQPLIELLRNQIAPAEFQSLPTPWIRPLSKLLPELAVAGPGTVLPEEPYLETLPAQARGQIFEAIRQLFIQVAKRQRVVLCLDDLHWSDEATLATLGYLLERPPFLEDAFILGAARWEEPNAHLEFLVSSLQQSGRFPVLPLARLNTQEVLELTSYATGQIPSQQVAEQLSLQTGGNPFILLESLQELVYRDSPPDLSLGVVLPVEYSTQKLISGQLERLRPEIKSLLEAAAIIGADIHLDLLRTAVTTTAIKLADGMEELERRKLIELQSKSIQVAYRFRHEKIREVILQQLSPARAELLHGLVAQALASMPGNDGQAAVIAEHYEKGGDLTRAFDHWLRAGEHARQLFSFADAQWCFSRAEKLISTSIPLTDQQIIHLNNLWTETAYTVEDAFTIQRVNAEMLALGRERNSWVLIGAAHIGLCDSCFASNQFDEGLSYVEQAINYLERSDNLYQLVRAYNRQGALLYMLSRIQDAYHAFQLAADLSAKSTEANMLQERGNAHFQLAIVNVLLGHPKIALNHSQKALADASASGHFHGQIAAYSAMGLAHHFIGDYRQSILELEQGIVLGQRTNAWRMLGYLYAYQAMNFLAVGEIDRMVASANRAIELGLRFQHDEIAGLGYRVLGEYFTWMKQPDKALEKYQEGAEISQNKLFQVDIPVRIATAMIQLGINEGYQLLEQAANIAQASGFMLTTLTTRSSQIMGLILQNEWEQALVRAELLFHEAEQLNVHTAILEAKYYMALAALRLDKFELAYQFSQDVVQKASTASKHYILFYIFPVAIQAEKALGLLPTGRVSEIIEIIAGLRKLNTQEPYRSAFEHLVSETLSEIDGSQTPDQYV